MHNVARRATPAVGADHAAPAALTAPLTPTSRLSAQAGTEGAMLYSNGVSALTSMWPHSQSRAISSSWMKV